MRMEGRDETWLPGEYGRLGGPDNLPGENGRGTLSRGERRADAAPESAVLAVAAPDRELAADDRLHPRFRRRPRLPRLKT